jgi:hypothetical protein
MKRFPLVLKIVVGRTGHVRINFLSSERPTPDQQSAMSAALRHIDSCVLRQRDVAGTLAAVSWLESDGVRLLSERGFDVSVERRGRWTALSVERPASGVLQ